MLGCTISKFLMAGVYKATDLVRYSASFTRGSLFDERRDDHLRAQISALLNNTQTTPEEALYQRILENAPEIAEYGRRQLAQILGRLIVEDPERRLSALKLVRDP
jgi:hypothetical protein